MDHDPALQEPEIGATFHAADATHTFVEKNGGSPTDAPSERNATLVDFEENDPENPINWPAWRRWVIVVLVSIMNLFGIVATVTIVPAIPQVLDEFHVGAEPWQPLIVSIWDLGEGVGPFLVGPLSELFGRAPVLQIGNVLAVLCSVAAALSTNVSMLVAFRFLNGFVMTALTLAPTIVGDLFPVENRGKAMAVAMFFQLVGPSIGPIIGSFIAGVLGWRWTIWIIAISVGAVTVFLIVFFRETYSVKILERKAARLNKQSDGNQTFRSKHQDRVDGTTIVQSLVRPITVMLSSPVVLLISLYTAIVYGLSFVILTTLTEILESTYGFGQSEVGLAFLGRAIGNIFGVFFYGFTSDRYIKYRRDKNGGVTKPEDRLPTMLLGAITLPVGLLLYGWSLAYRIQWIVPIIGTGIVGFSMLLAILPTENYLVDMFEVHAGSAVAAGVILRAVFAAIFPLAGPPLYDSLGLGWGNSLLAFIMIAFVPALLLLLKFGGRLKKNQASG